MATTSKRRLLDLLSRCTAASCVVLIGVASCTPLVSVNVTGGWSGTITWTSGPMASLQSAFGLDLFDDQGDVTGAVTLPAGGMNSFEIPITRGEVHADTIVLEAEGVNDLTDPATPVRFTFDGKAEATTMSGVGTQYVRGAAHTFTWRATLTAPPVPSP